MWGYRVPAGVKKHYTPADMIQMYKYQEVNGDTTVFVGEKASADRRYSYFIGMENPNLSRYVVFYDNQVILHSEMLRDPDYHFTLDEIREYAAIIEKKSVYIKEVIEDLNLTTRLRNKELSLQRKTVNMVTLLRSIVIDILNDPKYANCHIEFAFSEEYIPVEADEILMWRAINNLIYNALVHNDDGVKITVSVEKKERVRITIADDGKGIKKEELNRIFDRYYRGTNTGDAHKGSGLGMAIAHDIIKAHQGEIVINSEEGRGTVVKITL
ncbi:histidine kinase [Brevibacillus sp. CF112]|nr:histidine kinase [Brevibacillus sp. CF112]